jgi:hypothetical protein
MKSGMPIVIMLAAFPAVLYLWKAEYLPLIDYSDYLARIKIVKSIGMGGRK